MQEQIEFYTVEEVAKVLRLRPYTARRLCREKKVPAFKFGGQCLSRAACGELALGEVEG